MKEAVIKTVDKNGRPLSEKQIETNKKFAANRVELTSETAREYQKLGAIQRKKNNARKKNMQEIAKWLMDMPVKKGELLDEDEILELDSAKAINMTGAEALVLAQLQRAIAGDTASAQFIRDTAGEKPTDKLEVGGLTMEEYVKEHKVKF